MNVLDVTHGMNPYKIPLYVSKFVDIYTKYRQESMQSPDDLKKHMNSI